MPTIQARYIRHAKIEHICECEKRIKPRESYLYLFGDADDGTEPFSICVCEACIVSDLLPSFQAQKGYAWKDERIRAALAKREAINGTSKA